MSRNGIRHASMAIALGVLVLVGCSDDESSNPVTPPAGLTGYATTKLVGDNASAGATSIDANLVNPWGMAFGATGLLWVANNHTGTSTVYGADGTPQSLVVTIPSNTAATGGAPTGTIFNSTTDFAIPNSTAALFIFAGEDGVISAWNATSQNAAVKVADRSADNAVYKGLAMASNGGANFLYATNFKGGKVEVFDAGFHLVSSFTDATLPAGFAPFGIQNIGGMLYVTFAKQKGPDNEDDDPAVGNGYVDIFNPDGTMASRFASTGSLNSPWGIAVAPNSWGDHGGDILIGNFGDGMIGTYSASGAFHGMLQDKNSANIVIDGLWGLLLGTGANAFTVYYTAGPGDESHGVLGTIKPNP